MASPNYIQSPNLSTTPEQISPETSTPCAQKVQIDTSNIFEDTPVAKMDLSPPLLMAPGKGYGKIPKQEASTAINHQSEADDAEMRLASPIFNHGAQYPALNGDISEDMMDGVEQTSNYGSEEAENDNREEKTTHLLAPSVENSPDSSRRGVDSKSKVQIEWIGTSTFFLKQNLELQGSVSFSWKQLDAF